MAINPNQKELFICGYSREHIDGAYDIIQCLISFLDGDEGIPTMNANDIPMAEEYKPANQPKPQFTDLIHRIPAKYFIPQNSIPSRAQFVLQMKTHHNATTGIAIKAYQYLCKLRAYPPEGLESKANHHDIVLGEYQWIPSIPHNSELTDDVNEYIKSTVYIDNR